MDRLYSWKIVRSGAAMTIEHSCGKLAGFVSVEFVGEIGLDAPAPKIIATMRDGRQFELGGVRFTQGFSRGQAVGDPQPI